MSKDLAKMLRDNPIVEHDHMDALHTWRDFRAEQGCKSLQPLLTDPDANAKMAKSGLPDYSLSLAPASLSGWNVCPFSTAACRAGCVAHVGRGMHESVLEGRIRRTKFLVYSPSAFCTLVKAELQAAVCKYAPHQVGCRLNAFSDIPYEEIVPWMLDIPGVQFYDYTKLPDRHPPANYFLCYSCRMNTPAEDSLVVAKLGRGENVAIVFDVLYHPNAHKQEPLPTRYLGFQVIDGDHDDTRYRDPRGVIVGLRCKGKTLYNNPGSFVRKVPA